LRFACFSALRAGIGSSSHEENGDVFPENAQNVPMPIRMGIPLMPHLQAKPIIKYGNCAKRVSATRKTAPGA
jgi:hypothetical protein